MRRWSWSWVLLGACTGSQPSVVEEAEAVPQVRALPELTPPTGPVGMAGDEPQEWSASGQWVAVCRPDGERRIPKLLVGDDHELDLDGVLVAGPRGRFVVISRDGQRILYDALRRNERVMGPVGETSPGSFDEEGRRFLHARTTDGHDHVVVYFLGSDAKRVIESPVHPLTRASLDPSGRHVFMSAWEYEEDGSAPRDEDMCVVHEGCEMGRMARNVGNAVLDLDSPGADFIRVDSMNMMPRALGEAIVLDSNEGIELVTSDGRREVASDDCRISHTDWRDETLVLTCQGEAESIEYFTWHDGELSPLGFVREPQHWSELPIGGPLPWTAVMGRDHRWLSLTGRHVVQGSETQVEGYAGEGRVVLVDPDDGVELRDGASDTRVAHHDVRGSIHQAQGHYVSLKADFSGGWVLDLRDGTVRGHERPALALSRSGHVAVRDEDGRFRWR